MTEEVTCNTDWMVLDNIDSLQYMSNPDTSENDTIKMVYSGDTMFIPMDETCKEYNYIMLFVSNGDITIADAE